MSVTVEEIAGALMIKVSGDVGAFCEIQPEGPGEHYSVTLSNGVSLTGTVGGGFATETTSIDPVTFEGKVATIHGEIEWVEVCGQVQTAEETRRWHADQAEWLAGLRTQTT